MGLRRQAREHALKMLYQAEIAGLTAGETIAMHWQGDPDLDDAGRAFAERLVHAVLSDLPAIDALIRDVSHHWSIERMGTVDRNILRMSIGEMRSDTDTPAAVVIDEAVEIARTFGDTESQAFVNGLLEAARRKLAGQAPVRPSGTGELGAP